MGFSEIHGSGHWSPAVKLVVDVLLDPPVVDVDESRRERAVVVDELISHVEYVHISPRGSASDEH